MKYYSLTTYPYLLGITTVNSLVLCPTRTPFLCTLKYVFIVCMCIFIFHIYSHQKME